MDQRIKNIIERYHGWDKCDHYKIRRYCKICCWEIPAFMRKGEDAEADKQYFRAKILKEKMANTATMELKKEKALDKLF
jgi:hypothetical protein